MGVSGNQVRIGINAPKNLEVHREEIYTRIKEQQQDDTELAALVESRKDQEEISVDIDDL